MKHIILIILLAIGVLAQEVGVPYLAQIDDLIKQTSVLDNRNVITLEDDGELKIWDYTNGHFNYIFPNERITSFGLSEDKFFLMTADMDHKIILWNLQTKQKKLFDAPLEYVDIVVLGHKNDKVALVDRHKGEIAIVNLTTEKVENSFHVSGIKKILFSENESQIILLYENGKIHLKNLINDKDFIFNKYRVSDIALYKNKVICQCYVNGHYELLSIHLETHEEKSFFNQLVTYSTFKILNKYLILQSSNILRLLDLTTHQTIASIPITSGKDKEYDIAPDAAKIILAGNGIRVFDIKKATKLYELKQARYIGKIDFSKDDKNISLSYYNAKGTELQKKIFSLSDWKMVSSKYTISELETLMKRDDKLFLEEGKVISLLSTQKTNEEFIAIYNKKMQQNEVYFSDNTQQRLLFTSPYQLRLLMVSKDNSELLTERFESIPYIDRLSFSTIDRWDVQTGKVIQTLRIPTFGLNIVMSNNKKYLAYGNTNVYIYNKKDSAKLFIFDDENWVIQIPNGSFMASKDAKKYMYIKMDDVRYVPINNDVYQKFNNDIKVKNYFN